MLGAFVRYGVGQVVDLCLSLPYAGIFFFGVFLLIAIFHDILMFAYRHGWIHFLAGVYLTLYLSDCLHHRLQPFWLRRDLSDPWERIGVPHSILYTMLVRIFGFSTTELSQSTADWMAYVLRRLGTICNMAASIIESYAKLQ